MSLALVLVSALALKGAVDLQDRSEFRVRSPGTTLPGTPEQPAGPLDHSIDLETTPGGRLRLASESSQLAVAYGPRLTLQDLNDSVRPVVLHQGSLTLNQSLSQVHLQLDETATYGRQNFAYLAAATNPDGTLARPSTLPTAAGRDIAYASSSTTLTSVYTPDPRWTWSVLGNYLIAGGRTPYARQFLAQQRGGRVETGLEYAVSARDHVRLSASAMAMTLTAAPGFTTGPKAELLSGLVEWRTSFTEDVEGTIGAGVGVSRVRASPLPGEPLSSETHVFPAATAGLVGHSQLSSDDRLEARLLLQATSVVDRVTGLVDGRAQGTLETAWIHRPLTLRATGTTAQSLDRTSVAAIEQWSGTFAALLDLATAVQVEAGVREAWQRSLYVATDAAGSTAATPAFTQTVGYVALTLRAPSLSF